MNPPDIAIWGAVASSISAVVGLVAWLVKSSFKRQDEVTNRYFTNLEQQAAEQKATNSKLADTLGEQTRTLQAMGRQLDQQTDALRTISEAQRMNMARFESAVPAMTCANFRADLQRKP